MKPLKKLLKPYSGIVFPVTCICCGASTSASGKSICNWCGTDRFENAEINTGDILPERIRFLYSMWHFDKGGYLQKLLHDLKYHYLMGVGEELGYLLGKHFLDRADSDTLDYLGKTSPIIVAVPLHKKKRRIRGYNQARALARGVSRATGWDLAGIGAVSRLKSTKTQTGLSTAERSENLKGAFIIENEDELKGRFPIIIDDVFTTGATTFELADTITNKEIPEAGIMTVARA